MPNDWSNAGSDSWTYRGGVFSVLPPPNPHLVDLGFLMCGKGWHYDGMIPDRTSRPWGILEGWEAEAGSQERLANPTLLTPVSGNCSLGTHEEAGWSLACSSGRHLFTTSSC